MKTYEVTFQSRTQFGQTHTHKMNTEELIKLLKEYEPNKFGWVGLQDNILSIVPVTTKQGS